MRLFRNEIALKTHVKLNSLIENSGKSLKFPFLRIFHRVFTAAKMHARFLVFLVADNPDFNSGPLDSIV